MIRSMTGFGKGTEKSPYGKISAEIKTLNHKSLSITCNPFNGLFLLEEKLNGVFDGKVLRGKVFVKITDEAGEGEKCLHKVEINEKTASEYLKKIKKMQKKLNIKGEVAIQDLLTLPGVLENKMEKEEEEIWQYVRKSLEKAIQRLIKYREDEGKRLEKDFKKRLQKIETNLNQVKKHGKQSVDNYRKKLVQSIGDIAKSAALDKGRLETEVALFAKNSDVTEETTRLEGHLMEYKKTMSTAKVEAGKKLDFIAQEMQREANTIGAKSNSFEVSKAVIEIKSEIEKLREQIKNIE